MEPQARSPQQVQLSQPVRDRGRFSVFKVHSSAKEGRVFSRIGAGGDSDAKVQPGTGARSQAVCYAKNKTTRRQIYSFSYVVLHLQYDVHSDVDRDKQYNRSI